MIEIIREEDGAGSEERRGLPKDIKQMGKPDIGDRIYVEDRTYQQMHPYDSLEEKRAYVLLGRYKNYAGKQCIFVEAAIRLEEIAFDGGLPLWNDHTWAYIYKQLRREYDSMVIVGWALDIKGQLPNMTIQLEALHQANFGGAHQVLFLMDGLEREEAFYSSKNGHLSRRDGFYIYYEKEDGRTWEPEILPTAEVVYAKKSETDQTQETDGQNDRTAVREETKAWEQTAEMPFGTVVHRGNYRRQAAREEIGHGSPSYASTLLLTLVVCALGAAAYMNYEKMEVMEETLARMSQAQVAETSSDISTEAAETSMTETSMTETTEAGETTEMPEVTVETVLGEVQPLEENTDVTAVQDDAPGTSEDAGNSGAQTQEAASQETEPQSQETGTDETNEAAMYLQQGYYVVQKGDSLVGICRKIYQTTAMLDKLCEVNEIEDQDAIYAGQYLALPN